MDKEPTQDKTCCLGRFLDSHSFARNDMLVGGSVQPHELYPQRPRNGTQAVPYGFAGGWILSPAQVISETLHGDESSPLHCVVPFNHTGYIRNVAGGRLPPLRTHRWVIPFTRTGYIRSVPGTAHRPFPTVSLMGCTSAPVVPTMENAVLRLIHRLRRSPFPEGEGLVNSPAVPGSSGGRFCASLLVPTGALVAVAQGL